MAAAHRAHQGGKPTGSLMLEWQRAGIGRIYMPSGLPDTPHGRERLRALRAALTDLYTMPRWDILEALRDRQLRPLLVLNALRRGKLDTLPTAAFLIPLWPRWSEWNAKTPNEHTRDGREAVSRALQPFGPKAMTGDLPDLVRRYREFAGARAPSSANRATDQAMAFLRDTLGKDSPLWKQLRGLPRFAERRRKPKHLEPAEFEATLEQLPPAVAAAFASMCYTGMNPKEYWGAWELLPTYIAIHGTKTRGRERIVPIIGAVVRPTCSRDVLVWHLRKLGLTPYNARHTYSHWLEEARLPFSRQRAYMGHSAGSMTGHYQETRELGRWVVPDAAQLLAYLGRPIPPAKIRSA